MQRAGSNVHPLIRPACLDSAKLARDLKVEGIFLAGLEGASFFLRTD
jgi:hypothetical protein